MQSKRYSENDIQRACLVIIWKEEKKSSFKNLEQSMQSESVLLFSMFALLIWILTSIYHYKKDIFAIQATDFT